MRFRRHENSPDRYFAGNERFCADFIKHDVKYLGEHVAEPLKDIGATHVECGIAHACHTHRHCDGEADSDRDGAADIRGHHSGCGTCHQDPDSYCPYSTATCKHGKHITHLNQHDNGSGGHHPHRHRQSDEHPR